MFKFRRRYLAGMLLAVSLLTIGVAAWKQPGQEKHCNMFADSIVVENFDPDHPLKSLEGQNPPVTTSGGCYKTQAEALCAGTQGAICPPQDATQQEIDWAIRNYQYAVLHDNPGPGPWNWQPPK